jgi:hypothetical protein
MTLGRSLRLLLAVVVLVGWHAALLHPLQHVGPDGSFVHLTDGHSPDNSGKPQEGKNGLCDAIAAVAACIGASHALTVDAAGGFDAIPGSERGSTWVAPRLGYRSQAPPAVL